VGSFDRPNLFMSVKSRGEKMSEVCHALGIANSKSSQPVKVDGSSIVYCSTRAETEDMFNALLSYGSFIDVVVNFH
jgi:superfamily II DNA helicase RecQ